MTAQNLIDTSQHSTSLTISRASNLSLSSPSHSQRQVGVGLERSVSKRAKRSIFQRSVCAMEWSLTLLEAQLVALKIPPHCHNLYVNLPITVLTQPDTFLRLLRLPAAPLNIEIDPARFLALSDCKTAGRSQRLLRSEEGHGIWLDDIDEAIVQPFCPAGCVSRHKNRQEVLAFTRHPCAPGSW